MTPDDQTMLDKTLDELRAVRPALAGLSVRLTRAAAFAGQTGMCPEEAKALLALAKIAFIICDEDRH
jgi:hypothetical protein